MTKILEGRRSPPAGALAGGSPPQQHRDSTPGSAVPGRVVHCRRERYDVYIGRPSRWGNPFTLPKGVQRSPNAARARAAVIAKYEEWLKAQPELLAALHELRGKRLGCFCAPLPCHGDVLLRLANA